ncbi:hypothetical protein BJV82DRAFT_186471 [Fennellomyces sp. T-0311]|nr:hypothetical protein BJV82DRAFT_186471 [Fennellomyces sp. T-0311]
MYSTQDLINEWRSHVMQERTRTYDTITASPLNLLANTLDEPGLDFKGNKMPEKGTIVPATYHHVYFPTRIPEKDLASDGYEQVFHPPKPFDQRMWAGAELTWSKDNWLRVGDNAEMVTSVNRVEHKTGGRLGDAVMVWLDKDIYNSKGWSMREQRCLVYATSQQKHSGSRAITMKRMPDFSQEIHPTSILLFRYSALTFNAHMIHYDQNYATKVEKHPSCLVQGPLSSTLLITLLRTQIYRDTQQPLNLRSFQYKCLYPLYVEQPFTLCGRSSSNKTFDLWIVNHLGNLAVKGTAELA